MLRCTTQKLAEPIAKSGEYDVVIYGHTHEIDVRKEGTLIVNPGETGGWTTGRSTVAIVDLDSLEAEIREIVIRDLGNEEGI